MVAIRDLGWPRLAPIKQSSRHASQQISRSVSSQNVKNTNDIGIQRRPTRRVSEGDNPVPESELPPKHKLVSEPTTPMAPTITLIAPKINASATSLVKYSSASGTGNELQDNSKSLGRGLPRQGATKPVKSPVLAGTPPLRQKSLSISLKSPMRLLEPFPFEEDAEEDDSKPSAPSSNNSSSPRSFMSRRDKDYEEANFSRDSIIELIQQIPDTPIGGVTPIMPVALTPAGAYPTPTVTAPTSPIIQTMGSAYDGPATPLPSPLLPAVDVNTPSTNALPGSNLVNSLPAEDMSIPGEGLPKLTDGLPPGASPLDGLPTDTVTGSLPPGRIPTPTQGLVRALPLPNLPTGAVTGVLPADATGVLPAPGTPLTNVSKTVKAKKKVGKVAKIGRRVVLRKPVLALVVGRQLAGPTATMLKMVSRGDPLPDAIGMVGRIGDAVPVPISVVTGAVPTAATSALPA